MLGRLLREIGEVALGPLRALERALPNGGAAVQELLGGRPPVPDLDGPVPLDPRKHYVLRWLHKKRDFASFLRFADVVPCCFNGMSPMYRGSSDTQRWVLAAWQDPLSFCFWVMRQNPAGALEPRGFVLGSFALVGERPAVVLNGVYLRRQLPWLRRATVEAIEATLCRPLGIKSVAIAARYGGAGDLPAAYARSPREVHRLRALVGADGALMTTNYDDLSCVTNRTFTTARDTWWRDLDGGPASLR
jgi:hypothetical protein